MKLRKALIFVLCVVLALPLAACSKDGTGENGGGGDTIDPTKEYTVTFDVGDEARGNELYMSQSVGGFEPPAQKVKGGSVIGYFPTLPNFGNYTFVGWFDGNEQFLKTTKVTRNWNLKAKWNDNSAQAEIAAKYEENISSWDVDGHLYIHYKRAGHSEAEQDKKYNGNGPEYDDPTKAIVSNLYGDWGLWLWPTNGPLNNGDKADYFSYEGVLFYPAKIDESGAVYDILLDHTYTRAGWNENTLTDKGLNTNYTVNGTAVRDMKMQLFSVKSRKEAGFWKNDGGNVTLNNSLMKRVVNGKTTYHWFVTETMVGSGSPTFSNKVVEDVYKDDVNHDMFPTNKKLDMKSNVDNSGTYNINKVPVQDYSTTGVGYQIFIASFNDGMADDEWSTAGTGMGDLRGVIQKLDENYFTDLNVNILWLTPFQSSTNYHGYDIKDYYSVDPRFGTIEDYRELVYKAHSKGIKVVMDFVLNHTAENNPWFVKSTNLVKEEQADGSVIDYRNFYNWITKAQYDTIPGEPNKYKDDGVTANPNYNPNKAQWYEDSHGYYFYSSFGSSMPELNYDYQPVRDAILDVCNYWMEFGLDGFRCDAVKHIYMKNEIKWANGGDGEYVFEESKTADTDPYTYDVKRNMNFWREFNYKLKCNYPNAFIVGENLDGDPKNVEKFFAGMDSQFDFNSYYDAARSLTNSDNSGNSGWSGAIKSYLKSRDGEGDRSKGNLYYNTNYINGQFTSNHDLPRARDRLNSTTDGTNDDFHSFFDDNGTIVEDGGVKTKVYDDFVKNPTISNESWTKQRAERSDALLRLYYAYLMTVPGIAWIYNGDELGMTGIMNCIIEGGSANSSNSTPHEDRIYRQPMKWNDDVKKNASYDIGFNNYKCELVGLNTTNYVRGYDYQKTDATSIYSWMKTLTKVRNDHPELINGKVVEKFTSIPNGSVALSEYTVTGSTGTTKVYISTNGSVANKASGSNVYATWTSGKYSVMICKG